MEKQTHVLVFPFPIQGHINPMLQFSKRLTKKGLKVTVISTTVTATYVETSQADSINVETIFNGFKDGEKVADSQEFMQRYNSTVPHSLAELVQKYADTPSPVKCIIYDSIQPWAFDVARSFGIFSASFFTQSCGVTGLYDMNMEGEIAFPLKGNSVSLPCFPELELDDLPSFVHGPGPYPAIYDLMYKQFYKIDEVDWVLWNTFNALEDEVVNWMASKWAIKPIGPTIPSMFLDKRLEDDKDYGLSLFKPNSETCMQWLDSKPKASVIYISFGSLAALGEEQMEQVALGLKQTNRSFLWVVRETEVTKLPQDFIEETKELGLVVNWSPQLQVLAHESVGCFVTHCGWNSTLEALSLGVPMVAMPQWTDQPTNAKYVVDVWGVGVRVKKDEKGIVTKEEIERCISEVMDGEKGEEMRRNSEKWKKSTREAVDEGGSSDRNIDEFVQKLKGDSSVTVNGCKD